MFIDDIKLFAKDESELDALIQTVRVVSTDIGMKFGLEKCAMLVMKRGKVTKSDGISGCSKFAQKEYKRRHDCVARALHWDLCRVYDIQTTQEWYEHQPEGVVDKETMKE